MLLSRKLQSHLYKHASHCVGNACKPHRRHASVSIGQRPPASPKSCDADEVRASEWQSFQNVLKNGKELRVAAMLIGDWALNYRAPNWL